MSIKKLDQAYIYIDNRQFDTGNFIMASHEEIITAYKHLKSGSSLRLWLYLLHQVNGRNTIDRYGKARASFFLGIDRITNDTGLTRSTIYKAMNELIKFGLVSKKIMGKRTDILCLLTKPNLDLKTEQRLPGPNKENIGSEISDREFLPLETPQGNSPKKPDLKSDTTCNIETTLIKPPYPQGEKSKKSRLDLEMDSILENHKTITQENILAICRSLGNYNFGFINEDRDFSNVYTYIKNNTNNSRRKRDIRQAIKIHNLKHQANTQINQDAKNKKEPSACQKSTVLFTQDTENMLNSILEQPYSPMLHDTWHRDKIHKDHILFKLPKDIGADYIDRFTKKIDSAKKK
jgi:hypothetical protein